MVNVVAFIPDNEADSRIGTIQIRDENGNVTIHEDQTWLEAVRMASDLGENTHLTSPNLKGGCLKMFPKSGAFFQALRAVPDDEAYDWLEELLTPPQENPEP